jgi:hypothetical protein
MYPGHSNIQTVTSHPGCTVGNDNMLHYLSNTALKGLLDGG